MTAFVAACLAVSLLVLASAGCRGPASGGAAVPEGGWITLLHTNDIHGEYRALPGDGGEGSPPMGGFLALAGTVSRIREEAKAPILLLDAGDLMAGTPLTGVVRHGVRGGGTMELMNEVGYDVMALGNHEFDLGRENCLSLIGLAKFPILSANLRERATGKLFAPAAHVLFERKGIRVAVIGLILDELATVVAKAPIAGLEVQRGIDVVRAEVEGLDPLSDIIVILTHQGLDSSRILARAVPGIDIIVAGHDHKLTPKPIVESGVLIVEAGHRLQRLGRLDVKVEGDRVVEHRYELLDLPAAAGAGAPETMVALYHELEAAIEADYGQVVGELGVRFERDDEGESNIGNWVTDVMREAAGAEFAVTNSTALRTDVDPGPLTRGEIYSISPFPNVLATFRATGAQLSMLARKNARNALGKEKSIVQVSGIRYAYDPDGEVYDLEIAGQPVDLDRSYRGASTDYLLFSQGEKYLGFVPEDCETGVSGIFDLMCEAAARQSPILARVDGRMRALDKPPAARLRPAGARPPAGPEGGRACLQEMLLPEGSLPPLYTQNAAGLDRLLAGLSSRLPRFEDRVRALALARIGTPYALGTLGEKGGEDPDPVFRFDEADCTVLVLTTVALAHARSVEEAERWMGPANYRRRGEAYPVTYRNRLHFTSDRITSSPLFADITGDIARPEECESVHLTLNRRNTGEELLPLGWKREITLSYVPASQLEAALGRAPALCGIAFLRLGNIPEGFVVAHEGLLLDRRCLLHASSGEGKVVLVDVLDYMLRSGDPDPARAGRPRFDGAILYALREGAPELVGAESAGTEGDR